MTPRHEGWNSLDAAALMLVFITVGLFAVDRLVAERWVFGGILAGAACLVAIPAVRAFRGMDGKPPVDYERLGRTFRWW
jgi:hypothetical protein